MMKKLMLIAVSILGIAQGIGLSILFIDHIIYLMDERKFPTAGYLLGILIILLAWLISVLIILVFRKKFKINI